MTCEQVDTFEINSTELHLLLAYFIYIIFIKLIIELHFEVCLAYYLSVV